METRVVCQTVVDDKRGEEKASIGLNKSDTNDNSNSNRAQQLASGSVSAKCLQD